MLLIFFSDYTFLINPAKFRLVKSFLDGELDFEFSFLADIAEKSFDKDMRIDLLLSETLALAATGNKISPQNIQYWYLLCQNNLLY